MLGAGGEVTHGPATTTPTALSAKTSPNQDDKEEALDAPLSLPLMLEYQALFIFNDAFIHP